MAEALYRKYRPQVFGDVVGQEHIETTLKNAIEQNKVSHAYLFCGPRGTGKTTMARLLAKALLCSKGQDGPTPDPDGTCDDCQMIAAGEHPDVYELDAASRTGVENVREEIIGRVQFAPTRGRCKVYIIDEVHMLSSAAFNALLKTLEEPPDHVVFILATTDPQKVPETIHSRCQRFDFHRVGTDGMVARLGAVCTAEGVEFEGEALELIAHRAEGGMRNALTALEQLIAYGGGKVTLDVAERMLGGISSSDLANIMRAIGEHDAAACFRWVAAYVETGADLAQFARDMAAHVRDLYVMSLAGADVALEVGATERAQLVSELPLFGSDRLSRLLCVLGDVLAELKTSTNPRLSFEIALTRMVRPDSDLTLASLAERIEALELSGSVRSLARPELPDSVRSDEWPERADAAAAQRTPSCGSFGSVRSDEWPERADAAAAQRTPSYACEPSSFGSVRSDERPERVDAAAAQRTPSCACEPSSRPEGRFLGLSPQSGAPCAPSLTDVDQGYVAQPAGAAQPVGATRAVPSELAESYRNPAALQRMWQAALTALKRNKAAYGVLFLNTKAVFNQENATLNIEFPAENTFAFKASQKPEVQAAVAAALQQATGVALPFSYTQRGSGQGLGKDTFAPAAPVASTTSSRSTAPAAFTSHTSIEAPEPEVVPLDAYDSAPYEEPVPTGDAGVDPLRSRELEEPLSPAASAPTRSVSAIPAPAPVPSAPAPAPAPSAPAPAPAPSAPASPALAVPAPAPAPSALQSPAKVDLPAEPPVDARSSASIDASGPTILEQKDALMSVFGDGVVFDTVD
ncbi:DNA polymerase III subunit gamma/tau [Adlercreutzia sp. ZJ141]|uniref:DNA polymerase III subunit gamma/tau n=1 Tax=Adlercreutzia sp. ZJ141 TaxID=2709406 RepID=UPI0013EB9821|nr:DNA polymerase III subunit gamma/tau [Adlercreutzia sp. ZJ141]